MPDRAAGREGELSSGVSSVKERKEEAEEIGNAGHQMNKRR